VLVLLALVVLPVRGQQPPPTGRGGSARGLVAFGAVGGLALIGGGVGLVLLAATAALTRAARARRRIVLPGLAAGSLLAAGAVHLTLSGDVARVAVQVLALLAVCAVVVAVLAGDRRPRIPVAPAPAGRPAEEGS
jgi:Ca2+/Na+ antiporter